MKHKQKMMVITAVAVSWALTGCGGSSGGGGPRQADHVAFASFSSATQHYRVYEANDGISQTAAIVGTQAGGTPVTTVDGTRNGARMWYIAGPSENVSYTASEATPGGPSQTTVPGSPAEWDYQGFGAWQTSTTANNVTTVNLYAVSSGAMTPGSAIPTEAGATYIGSFGGVYFDGAARSTYTVTADFSAAVDFAARTVGFATTGSQTSLNGAGPLTANPGLDMSGNLSYPAGSNNITGAVSTASGMNGTATGRFYGPAGQEIGGTLAVQSGVGAAASTLVGAFGGKK